VKKSLRPYLGKKLDVIIDRPLGSKHPTYGFIYPLNYGYVPGSVSEDGQETDAYVVGIFEPLVTFQGKVIGVIERVNDAEDKLVIAGLEKSYTKEQIEALVEFQERFFLHQIITE